jgi:hypothetical protein
MLGPDTIVGAVLLDFSASFDVIDHNLLLKKHRRCGFASSALLWIESYISNRTKRVLVNGSLMQIQLSVVYHMAGS